MSLDARRPGGAKADGLRPVPTLTPEPFVLSAKAKGAHPPYFRALAARFIPRMSFETRAIYSALERLGVRPNQKDMLYISLLGTTGTPDLFWCCLVGLRPERDDRRLQAQ